MAEDATGTDTSVNPDSSVEVSQEPAGESFTVKVDGLEEQVSLEELRDGYQRQSDYTRKTQELASERKRLEQAEAIVSSLESDPESTLKALGDAFGISAAPEQSEDLTRSSWDEPDDATSKRLQELEGRVQGYDRIRKQEALEKQVSVLKGKYGDFDQSELFQHALRNKIGNLEAALTHMRYDGVASKAEKLEKEQERTEAKRGASIVEPSGSKQAGSSRKNSEKATSIREAFLNAKQELSS
tara:strand:- start:43 stop:768 length:726 start_codon:yes stop_codon:yes gene_type:complete